MRHLRLIGLAALTLAACRTHTVDTCLPACDATDQTFFAECVASGEGACQPGNRRCCALAAECLGDLDDQTVVSSRPMCMAVASDACFPPCTDADATTYDACVTDGTAACSAGDENCCALAANCLGSLGDVFVSADGCCATDADCTTGTCDTLMTWTCVGAPSGCGDGMVTGTEQCDDHNTVTESCTYGLRMCTVCDLQCNTVAGVTHFCGDGTTDLSDGETCDPPSTTCDTLCHTIAAMPSCTNHIRDGNETDVDCGGGTCSPCMPGDSCALPSDCQSADMACGGRADCAGANPRCTDVTRCDDGNVCTDDFCGVTGGCNPVAIDRDDDGEGPEALGCGLDCNDHDSTIFSTAPELCDGIDQDCDHRIDESCT